MMRNYFESIVKPLLKEPDALSIEETTDAMGVLLSVRVSKNDMGTCVGKGGATANAIRLLLKIYGGQRRAVLSVKFLEPLGSIRNTITESTPV